MLYVLPSLLAEGLNYSNSYPVRQLPWFAIQELRGTLNYSYYAKQRSRVWVLGATFCVLGQLLLVAINQWLAYNNVLYRDRPDRLTEAFSI